MSSRMFTIGLQPHTVRVFRQGLPNRLPPFTRAQDISRNLFSQWLLCIHHPPKTIVLEQPDKFRPPSHPQRLSKRPPRQYPGPPLSEAEIQTQKTKRYPHMFPNPGTRMYWFLTNKWLHMWINITVLLVLGLVTVTQSFLHTSPYAHLIPPISTLPFHPITYISETLSVLKLHIDYNSEQVAEKRRNQVLDAQKQRLYRRAHGMEDLDAEEESGVDVRGLVPWDDGLTKTERAAGGRSDLVSGRLISDMKTKVDGKWVKVSDLAREEMEGTARIGAVTETSEVNGTVQEEGFEQQQQQQQRQSNRWSKPKRWFGIW